MPFDQLHRRGVIALLAGATAALITAARRRGDWITLASAHGMFPHLFTTGLGTKLLPI